MHTYANSITVSAILISTVCKYENMWKLDQFETKGTVTFTVVLRMLVGEIESFCWEPMRFARTEFSNLPCLPAGNCLVRRWLL